MSSRPHPPSAGPCTARAAAPQSLRWSLGNTPTLGLQPQADQSGPGVAGRLRVSEARGVGQRPRHPRFPAGLSGRPGVGAALQAGRCPPPPPRHRSCACSLLPRQQRGTRGFSALGLTAPTMPLHKLSSPSTWSQDTWPERDRAEGQLGQGWGGPLLPARTCAQSPATQTDFISHPRPSAVVCRVLGHRPDMEAASLSLEEPGLLLRSGLKPGVTSVPVGSSATEGCKRSFKTSPSPRPTSSGRPKCGNG